MNIKLLLKAYFNELFFPDNSCALCQKTVEKNNYLTVETNRFYSIPAICSLCKEQLEIPRSPYCRVCHKALENEPAAIEGLICDDCRQNKSAGLIYNRSAVIYNPLIKEMIAQYKYRGRESLADIFGDFLAIAYDQYFSDKRIDYLTYVPIHSNRLKARGFNQSQLLASKLGRYTGIPVVEVLTKIRDTEKQSKQGKLERLKQIEGSFALNGDGKNITDKNILLIDDIYTTGSTISACTTILKNAGANQVYSLTLARA